MKKIVIPCLAGLALLFGLWLLTRITEQVLFSTSSPAQHYKVEITQSQSLPFFERAAFLNAQKDGNRLVRHKLLYTSDVGETEFRDLYPNPRFSSESVYELGTVDLGDGSSKEHEGELRILNETSRNLSYLLIETGWHKTVVLNIGAGAMEQFDFGYAPEIFCQGQFADSGDRFATAVSVDEGPEPTLKRQFSIRIKPDTAVIESSRRGLAPARCCAWNRPDPAHELLY